jgi:DNA-binding NtrC family response regulator
MTPEKPCVLVIDDDSAIQELLKNFLEAKNFKVECYSKPEEALSFLQSEPDRYIFILTDLRMPEVDGLEFVARVTTFAPKIPIILMTAFATIEVAVNAIHSGAYDFVVKPIDFKQLTVAVDRCMKFLQLRKENESLKKGMRTIFNYSGAVGKSEAMQQVFDLVKRVAPSTANILITGESGVGKEVVARAIHQMGNRKDAPFVPINCSAIPDNLLESELFGYTRGAFTGANEKKPGLLEEANGGVLFLDEIGDMNGALQAKLLRVIQERKIKRLGENHLRPVNIRVIAATHKDLKTEIEAGRFREDLFYRICVIPIAIPALRDRKEDIFPLAYHFLEIYRAQNESSVKDFSKQALERLLQHPWRGNVRELENAIERAVVLSKRELIEADDLPQTEFKATKQDLNSFFEKGEPLISLEEFSQRYVEFVLKSVKGVKEKAAQILEIDRKTLYRKLVSLQAQKASMRAS